MVKEDAVIRLFITLLLHSLQQVLGIIIVPNKSDYLRKNNNHCWASIMDNIKLCQSLLTLMLCFNQNTHDDIDRECGPDQKLRHDCEDSLPREGYPKWT